MDGVGGRCGYSRGAGRVPEGKWCEYVTSGVPTPGLQHLSHVTSDKSLHLPETLLLFVWKRVHGCPSSQGWARIQAMMCVYAQPGAQCHTVGLRKWG